jgi:hypothetical protein
MAADPIDFKTEKPVPITDALSQQAKDYDCLPCRLMGAHNPTCE